MFCFAWNLWFWLHCTACVILVPWPGIEPMPLAVEAQNPKHWTAREFRQCFFYSTHKWNFTRWICFSVWLISLNITSSGSSHIVANDRISSFSFSGLIIILFGVVLRWQRNRRGRIQIHPPQIHWKNIWTLSKFHKTTSECWQRTSGTQKGSPLSSKGGSGKYKS